MIAISSSKVVPLVTVLTAELVLLQRLVMLLHQLVPVTTVLTALLLVSTVLVLVKLVLNHYYIPVLHAPLEHCARLPHRRRSTFSVFVTLSVTVGSALKAHYRV